MSVDIYQKLGCIFMHLIYWYHQKRELCRREHTCSIIGSAADDNYSEYAEKRRILAPQPLIILLTNEVKTPARQFLGMHTYISAVSYFISVSLQKEGSLSYSVFFSFSLFFNLSLSSLFLFEQCLETWFPLSICLFLRWIASCISQL